MVQHPPARGSLLFAREMVMLFYKTARHELGGGEIEYFYNRRRQVYGQPHCRRGSGVGTHAHPYQGHSVREVLDMVGQVNGRAVRRLGAPEIPLF